MAPPWTTTSNASSAEREASSFPRPRSEEAKMRWPVELTGRYSVMPSTSPSTIACHHSTPHPPSKTRGLILDRWRPDKDRTVACPRKGQVLRADAELRWLERGAQPGQDAGMR